MIKSIDLKDSVYQITEQYPEMIAILKELGFLGIANPIARNTMGRVTTIPQGCKQQGKDLQQVLQQLKEKGFEIK